METFILRLVGGPRPSNAILVNDQQYPWPLPEFMPVLTEAGEETGFYHKVCESGLPPQPEDSPLMRGAMYEWITAP